MTPYGAPLLFALVVLIAIVVVMVSLRRSNARDFGGDDNLPQPIRLSGRGAFSSQPIHFRAGAYRAEYVFSEEWGVAVYLVSATTGDKDMLLYKTGSGAVDFTVEADERAVVQVEPTADRVDWRIELRSLRRLPTSAISGG